MAGHADKLPVEKLGPMAAVPFGPDIQYLVGKKSQHANSGRQLLEIWSTASDQNPDEYRLGDKLEAAETSDAAQEGAVVVTSCLPDAYLAGPTKCYLLPA